ncbi:hypothetical protein [Microbacterium sp. YY-01]|uniref:hypothetical protein n=1 Tax=Microbacterium sp. YY-01 TaxID=3421634 RepID=UPI003D1838BB
MSKKFTFGVMIFFGVLALIAVGVGLVGLMAAEPVMAIIGLVFAAVFWIMSISLKKSFKELSE